MVSNGSVSEWLKEADCKSVAKCYVGSNPTRPTDLRLENSKQTFIRAISIFRSQPSFEE